MREHLRLALQRKKEAAEKAGLTDQVAKIDARLAETSQDDAADAADEGDEIGVSLTAAAQRKADELGLTAEDFKRRRPSGTSGFTVADVERIAEARQATDPGDEEGGE